MIVFVGYILYAIRIIIYYLLYRYSIEMLLINYD